jgi:hypothetical protein
MRVFENGTHSPVFLRLAVAFFTAVVPWHGDLHEVSLPEFEERRRRVY